MRAPARSTVFEHDWAKVAEFAGALCTALPVVIPLADLMLSVIDIDLLGPIRWPGFRLSLGALVLPLAFAIVFPLAFALPFACALSFVFALTLSWAFRVPSALAPRSIGLII